jgi:hypothetical protein
VSDQRLLRRNNGVYYYRRRVPLQLVATFGKKFVQVSLHITSLQEANTTSNGTPSSPPVRVRPRAATRRKC